MAKKPNSQIEWPADKVERREIDSLIPYVRNPRVHSDAQIAQIAASIKEFGFTIPLLIDEDGTLIAGHGRLLAAKQLDLKEVPVMTARGWTEAQRKAYVIADNQLTLNSAWDSEMLSVELADLKTEGFDLDLLGFDAGQLAAFSLEQVSGENDVRAEWKGMPEFNQTDQTSFRSITIHFKDEKAVEDFIILTKMNITPQTRSAWFLEEAERAKFIDKRYEASVA